MQSIRKTMRQKISSCPFLARYETAISITKSFPMPEPTCFCLSYMGPESYSDEVWRLIGILYTTPRTVERFPSFASSWLCIKRRLALHTVILRHAQPPSVESNSVWRVCGNVVRRPRLSGMVMSHVLATEGSVT